MSPRQPLSRLVADQIRSHISNGLLLPGQKLNEREIMDQLGITRTPLREAISILSGEKLVEMSPNRGTVVTVLNDDEIKGLLDVRSALERLAGVLAVENVCEEEIVALDKLRRRMNDELAREDRAEWWNSNRQFHRSIIAISGNPFLIDYYANISIRMTVYNHFNRVAVTTTERWESSSREHDLIMAHLKARDGEALGALLEQHLQRSWHVARSIVMEQGSETSFFATLFKEQKARESVPSS